MNSWINDQTYQSCCLCPRMCRTDRRTQRGFCGCTSQPKAARAALHHWEEPCISGPDQGPGGSGTVFFSGCTLKCCFCQNYTISAENFGQEITAGQLGEMFLRLQDQGAWNINLVTATQFLPHVLQALDQVKSRLAIPVVYNCGGYERVETVRALEDYVDIWLPDFKYMDNRLAARYSSAPDYFETASAAIGQMIRQTGAPVFQEMPAPGPGRLGFSLMKRGVIIRHLVLPSHRQDSIQLLRWISSHFPKDQFLISLLSQYTPFYRSREYPELNRKITTYEYEQVVEEALRLGLSQGFMQQKTSAREEYTPPFDLEGLPNPSR